MVSFASQEKRLKSQQDLLSRLPKAKTTKVRAQGKQKKNQDGPRVCANCSREEIAHTLGTNTALPGTRTMC